MNKNSKPKVTETKHDLDHKTFEKQPKEKKELMKLEDHHEKTSGPKQIETHRKIKEKSRKLRP